MISGATCNSTPQSADDLVKQVSVNSRPTGSEETLASPNEGRKLYLVPSEGRILPEQSAAWSPVNVHTVQKAIYLLSDQ